MKEYLNNAILIIITIIIIIITVDSLLTDTSLRRTLSAGSKGVRLRES